MNCYSLAINYRREKSKNMDTRLYRKIMRLDNLTGLRNRYSYENYIKEIAIENKKIFITSLDMNYLKKINDTLGHDIGDIAINGLANHLMDLLPQTNIYRIGGDEFMLFTDEDCGYELNKLKNNKIHVDGVPYELGVSFSYGSELFDPSKDNIDDIIKKSDDLMYEYKQKYKERVNNVI